MRKKFFYKFLLVILTIFPFIALYLDSNNKALDSNTYCIALAIDVGDTSNLELSFELPVNSSSGDSSGGESKQSTSSNITSIECETMDSGISLMNSYLTQQIDLSHCKAILISDEYAKNGVSDIIYTLINKFEISSDCLLIITKGSANKLLTNAASNSETVSAKYFMSSVKSSYTSGFTCKETINDFYLALKDNVMEPSCCILSEEVESNKVSKESPSESSDSKESEKGNEDLPKHYGIAIFKHDKLIRFFRWN